MVNGDIMQMVQSWELELTADVDVKNNASAGALKSA